MTEAGPEVLLVGHCAPDAAMLGMAVRRAMPGASVVSVTDQVAFEAALPKARYALVNRVLDGSFDVELGVDLMRGRDATWSLISRYADAQQEARKAGALEGFDKGQLYEARTLEIIRGACTTPRKDHTP